MNKQQVLSLYRSYLRQVRTLPHFYLRHFFAIKGGDDFRSVLKTKSVNLRRTKLKRVLKDLQLLRAANGGKSTAFDRMLDIAYGRIGRLRWELMEPLLSDTKALLISLRKNQTEEECSPTYPPELVALLTSSISRTTKPLQMHQLVSPLYPSRAKTDPTDRVLLGPPSRRREHNFRWRFFQNEWKKVYPPLGALQQHSAHLPKTLTPPVPPLNFGCQNVNPLQDLFALAGLPSCSPIPPSKAANQQIQQAFDANPFSGSLPLRWLRRRYQALLGRIPLLTARPLSQVDSKCTYDVRLVDNAITTSRPHPSRLRLVDANDLSWIRDVNSVVRSDKCRE